MAKENADLDRKPLQNFRPWFDFYEHQVRTSSITRVRHAILVALEKRENVRKVSWQAAAITMFLHQP